ncbi:MAG: hypothetical protein QM813_17165 [Verrucomicrobiota bacterium]
MALKIYVVQDADGRESLVKAHTAAGALAFKRSQIVMSAAIATQDDLVSMIGRVVVETIPSRPAQTDIEDDE